MGWKKKDFDKQFEAVKRTTLFGRIDFENWIKSEITYNEMDLRVEVDRQINNMIVKGERLKRIMDQGITLSEDEKRFVELSVIKQLEIEFQNRRYDLMEKWNEKVRQEYLLKLKGKKKKIAELGMQDKMTITNKLFQSGKVQGDTNGFLFQATLHNLEDFADLIDDVWLIN